MKVVQSLKNVHVLVAERMINAIARERAKSRLKAAMLLHRAKSFKQSCLPSYDDPCAATQLILDYTSDMDIV